MSESDKHNQTWLDIVAAKDEEIKHLRQENERLEQALGLHAIEERKLRDRLNDNRRF